MKSQNVFLVLMLFGLGTSCASSAKKPEPAAAPEAKPTTAAPAVAAAPANPGVVCKFETEERKLEVANQGAGCVVNYTKSGKTNAVASALNGRTHCETVLARIRKKLEDAGYHCQ